MFSWVCILIGKADKKIRISKHSNSTWEGNEHYRGKLGSTAVCGRWGCLKWEGQEVLAGETTLLQRAEEGKGTSTQNKLQQAKALMWACAFAANSGKVASMADCRTERSHRAFQILGSHWKVKLGSETIWPVWAHLLSVAVKRLERQQEQEQE